MRRHTPGPWFVAAQNDALVIRRITTANGDIVAKLDYTPHEICAANANLIAAAPELLQVSTAAWHLCESLLANHVEVREFYPGPTGELISEVRDALKAAIAKAEGRS